MLSLYQIENHRVAIVSLAKFLIFVDRSSTGYVHSLCSFPSAYCCSSSSHRSPYGSAFRLKIRTSEFLLLCHETSHILLVPHPFLMPRYDASIRDRLDRIESLLHNLVDSNPATDQTSSSSSVPHFRQVNSASPSNPLRNTTPSEAPAGTSGETEPGAPSSAYVKVEGHRFRGAGGATIVAEEEHEDNPVGTMSGGRFYGPSAMSSVSSSRMSKILQDVSTYRLLLLLIRRDSQYQCFIVSVYINRSCCYSSGPRIRYSPSPL